MSKAIEICDLSVGYGKRVVASGLNAEVRGGEFVCLLGPNGAGKSTLLRTITGDQAPLSGSVKLDGVDVRSLSPAALSRKIAVVLPHRIELQHLTVRQLVEYGRIPYTGRFGALTAEDRDIVDAAIRMVGIEALSERLISSLSDGENQKAMIARALAQDTPVLLLDEPTAFLDYPSRVATMRLLADLAHERGIAVVMSTHDVELAVEMADSLLLIDSQGKLASAPPRVMLEDGSLRRVLCFNR